MTKPDAADADLLLQLSLAACITAEILTARQVSVPAEGA